MDPITDMLNQIRNGQAVKKPEVSVPLSNLKYEVAKVLADAGFVGDAKKAVKGKNKILKITLKYDNGIPAISGLRRISKSGQRIYAKLHDIKSVRGGYGISVVSTPRGLMTNKEAKKQKLGGEILLEIW